MQLDVRTPSVEFSYARGNAAIVNEASFVIILSEKFCEFRSLSAFSESQHHLAVDGWHVKDGGRQEFPL